MINKKLITLVATGNKGNLYTLRVFCSNSLSDHAKPKLTCTCPAGVQGDLLCRHKKTLLTRIIRENDSMQNEQYFIHDMFDNGLNINDDLKNAMLYLKPISMQYIELVHIFRELVDKYHKKINDIDCEINQLEDMRSIMEVDDLIDEFKLIHYDEEVKYYEQSELIKEKINGLVKH